MREQRYGRVVNTSSNSGILGNFGQTNYGAAKMGLVGLTRVLAAEGARYNIKVNAIAPLARTRMTQDLLGEALAPQLDPELVSPVVAWLVHEDVPVTGEVFIGGWGPGGQVLHRDDPGLLQPAADPGRRPGPFRRDPGRGRLHGARRRPATRRLVLKTLREG